MKTKAFKAKMILNDDTYETLSVELRISPATLSNKVLGKTSFTTAEIKILAKRWNLSADEINEIFLGDE